MQDKKLVMELKPRDLENEGYELLSTLDHDELIPFLKESFQKKSTVISWFNFWNIFLQGRYDGADQPVSPWSRVP